MSFPIYKYNFSYYKKPFVRITDSQIYFKKYTKNMFFNFMLKIWFFIFVCFYHFKKTNFIIIEDLVL